MLSFFDVLFIIFYSWLWLMLYRITWVHRKRMKILHKMGPDFLDSMSSYNAMMLKFWIWDINKFFK